jgi:hypothetical protein
MRTRGFVVISWPELVVFLLGARLLRLFEIIKISTEFIQKVTVAVELEIQGPVDLLVGLFLHVEQNISSALNFCRECTEDGWREGGVGCALEDPVDSVS